jgi:excinuclease ABC subunit C
VNDRPPASTIPIGPGSYQFKDREGRIIYVGKALSIRSRLSSYFAKPEKLAPRTRQMMATAQSVEWIEVRNELEALVLEFNLIKTHKPRFNIDFKDDKSYPFLAVTTDEKWPRAVVMREAKRKGVRYFGPYVHAYAIRETLDLLLRTFPIRTCSDSKLNRHKQIGQPCLYAHIEKCSAPCVDAITEKKYADLVKDLLAFLDGDTDPVTERLELMMNEASSELEFERAARLRDQLSSVKSVIERQQMVAEKEEDFDMIGIEEDELEASVQLFHVRRGRVVGRRGVVIDKVEDLDTKALIQRLLEQLYGDAQPVDVPREIFVPCLPSDHNLTVEFLSQKRGKPVAIRAPQRGSKRELMEMVTHNAGNAFVQHRLKRSSDHNARAKALSSLQSEIGLEESPLRIECFDISNLQGTQIVASMVVMEDGLMKKSEYRHFKLRIESQDDFASMEEALTRRFRKYLEEREEGARVGKRFSYPPNLLVVDGGKGQLNVAVRVLEDLGLDDIAVISLAKKLEEVYVPDRSEPLGIARDSEALYLLQQVRDEAHRFAITYHRKLRAKAATRSELDDVVGLGPSRRSRLLRDFGSVKALRAVSEQEILSLSWLPDDVGRSLYAHLHRSKRATRGD